MSALGQALTAQGPRPAPELGPRRRPCPRHPSSRGKRVAAFPGRRAVWAGQRPVGLPGQLAE